MIEPAGRSAARPAIRAGRAVSGSVGDDLGATVLGAPFRRVVAGDRPGLAVAMGGEATRLDALADQVVAYRLGAALGELPVVRVAPHRVGVPLDHDMEARVVAQRLHRTVEHVTPGRVDRGAR